jgi:hypothetical protein
MEHPCRLPYTNDTGNPPHSAHSMVPPVASGPERERERERALPSAEQI